jgi:integrase/recombinase XerD
MTITQAYELYEQQALLNRAEATKRNHRSAIRSFVRAVGDVPVLIISKQTVANWEWDMRQRGDSGTNMRDYMAKLRRILRFLRDYDIKVMNPREIDLPKNDTRESVWLLPDEVMRMFQACANDRERALMAAFWAVGGRPGEVLNLDRSDIEKEYITICGKGGRYREITIDPWARAHIYTYLASRKDNYPPVFLSAQRRRLSVQRAEQIFHEIAMRAGIEKNVTPYTLRHSFVADMLGNGAPLKEVSQLVGHTLTSTTLNTYHHVLPTQKWDVKKKYHTEIS